MTLGDYGRYTVDDARKLARKCLVSVDSGLDRLEARRKDAQGETVEDLCAAYIEHYAKPNIRIWPKDQSRINRLILSACDNRKVKAITRKDVEALHAKIGKGVHSTSKKRKAAPCEANRTLVLISKMFALAGERGFVSQDFVNPARGIKRFGEYKRDRWISPRRITEINPGN
jgi:hypothetical protein